jgi:GT2 family glycosyltransferase
MMHKLSIVTIHYRCEDVLQALLDSAPTLGPLPEVEWIIVDHSPTPPGLAQNLRFPVNIGSVRVIEYPQKKGFGEGCNIGARNSDGEVLFFLNPDCRFRGGRLLAVAERLIAEEDTAVLSPLLVTTQGQPEFSFYEFPGLFAEARLKCERVLIGNVAFIRRAVSRRFEQARWVDWVTGGALFVKRGLFLDIGGFDDGYFLYFEDADLCKRLKNAGYRIGFEPALALTHDHGHGGSTQVPSGKSNVYRSSQVRYYMKHRNPAARFLLEAYLRATGRFPRTRRGVNLDGPDVQVSANV